MKAHVMEVKFDTRAYTSWRLADLRKECRKRGLPEDGAKPVVVSRLEDYDKAAQASKSGGKPDDSPLFQQQTNSHGPQAQSRILPNIAPLPVTGPKPGFPGATLIQSRFPAKPAAMDPKRFGGQPAQQQFPPSAGSTVETAANPVLKHYMKQLSQQFEDPLAEEYFCTLCSQLAYNTVTLVSCGHSFCQFCIEKGLISGIKRCPQCNGLIEKVVPNQVLNKIIHSLKLRCTNPSCSELICLGDLQAHMKQCYHASDERLTLQCVNCSTIMHPLEAVNHDCPSEVEPCELCGKKLPRKNLEKHLGKVKYLGKHLKSLMDMQKLKITWRANISEHSPSDSWIESCIFSMRGMQFQLFLHRKEISKPNTFGVYLSYKPTSDTQPGSLQPRVHYRFRIGDKRTGNCCNFEEHTGYGKHAIVEDIMPFLDADGCLFVHCEIKLLGITIQNMVPEPDETALAAAAGVMGLWQDGNRSGTAASPMLNPLFSSSSSAASGGYDAVSNALKERVQTYHQAMYHKQQQQQPSQPSHGQSQFQLGGEHAMLSRIAEASALANKSNGRAGSSGSGSDAPDTRMDTGKQRSAAGEEARRVASAISSSTPARASASAAVMSVAEAMVSAASRHARERRDEERRDGKDERRDGKDERRDGKDDRRDGKDERREGRENAKEDARDSRAESDKAGAQADDRKRKRAEEGTAAPAAKARKEEGVAGERLADVKGSDADKA